MSTIEIINKEINTEISKPEVAAALLATTFKGLQAPVMKQAIMEGMMRGYTFKDFLEKNIYAIPYGSGYSLVTSVDHARKVGMRSGIVGVSAPTYEMDGDKIISCTVTVKRKIIEHIGEYAATAYFSEYTTGRNLWTTKPRTMIAKVAEMHALRKACPEELAQSYVEEEVQQQPIKEATIVDINEYSKKLSETKTLKELGTVWAAIPVTVKQELEGLKNELKQSYENTDLPN